MNRRTNVTATVDAFSHIDLNLQRDWNSASSPSPSPAIAAREGDPLLSFKITPINIAGIKAELKASLATDEKVSDEFVDYLRSNSMWLKQGDETRSGAAFKLGLSIEGGLQGTTIRTHPRLSLVSFSPVTLLVAGLLTAASASGTAAVVASPRYTHT